MQTIQANGYTFVPRPTPDECIYEVWDKNNLKCAISFEVDNDGVESWTVTPETTHPSISLNKVREFGLIIEAYDL